MYKIIGEIMLGLRMLFSSVNSSEEAAEVYLNYVTDKENQIREAAYYKWLNGSTNTEQNWLEAEEQFKL
jgi:ABC-type glycerol-3-phosphate transport system substrate-binding protein